MVMKNSEYRTSYKPATEEDVKAYEQNLDFRTNRKSREFQHNQDAFCWGPQAWEKTSETSSVMEEPRPGSVPSHRYKHKLYNQMFQEKQLRESLQQHCVVGSGAKFDGTRQNPEEGPPSPPPSLESSTPPHISDAITKPSVSSKLPENSKSLSKKPSKPQQKVISKKSAIGPKSSAGVPKKSAVASTSPREDKPPFLMYGGRDNEIKIGHQKTHNIRAVVDVYPSAVRAQKYRQVLKEKRQKSAPQVGGKRRPLTFDQLMDKQTASWQTEYSGHFMGYAQKEYERSVSSRMSGRKSVNL